MDLERNIRKRYSLNKQYFTSACILRATLYPCSKETAELVETSLLFNKKYSFADPVPAAKILMLSVLPNVSPLILS